LSQISIEDLSFCDPPTYDNALAERDVYREYYEASDAWADPAYRNEDPEKMADRLRAARMEVKKLRGED